MVKMNFSFKINQEEAELLNCLPDSNEDITENASGSNGADEILEVPNQTDGYPVTAVGAYAFSASGGPGAEHVGNVGGSLRELRLPESVRKIGRYAFYGCAGLEKIVLTDALTDIAGGVFTGCRLKEVEIHLYNGEKCCLRDIIAENRFCLRVTLHYHRGNAGADSVETAKLIFPEHYEEAVENTPARIVMTEYHGSGGNYRQCVYNKEVDYKRYDEFFVYAEAREEKQTVLELVFGRLLWPYRLTNEAKARYEEYIRRESVDAAAFLIEREDEQGLRYLADEKLWLKESLDAAIGEAARMGKTHLVSMLMEEKHQNFPQKKKVFEW